MPLGGFGFNTSRSRSSSYSSSVGASTSQSSGRVFGADAFSGLFADASAVARGVPTEPMVGAANRLFDSGTSFLDSLNELSAGEPVGEGEQYMLDQLSGGNALVDEEIASLQSDLGEFFGEVVMPGVRGDAVAAGGLGGSREGVIAGQAGRDLLREFGRGSLAIRQNDQQRRLGVANSLASIQQQRQARRLAAAGAGLGALPQQFSLLQAGSLAALSPYAALAEILGPATVLTDSSSYGYETSGSQSQSSGKSFGFEIGMA